MLLNCRPERSPECCVNEQLAHAFKETVGEVFKMCMTWDSLAADPF